MTSSDRNPFDSLQWTGRQMRYSTSDDGRTTTDHGHAGGPMLPSDNGHAVDGTVTSDQESFDILRSWRRKDDNASDISHVEAASNLQHIHALEDKYRGGATSSVLAAWESRATSLNEDYTRLHEDSGTSAEAGKEVGDKCTVLMKELDAGTVAGSESCHEIFLETWKLRSEVQRLLDKVIAE